MPDWLDKFGYRLCWRVSWFSQFVWCQIWYRYRCPVPIIDDHSARACAESGYCGCDNKRRYHICTCLKERKPERPG